jgi:preprotein translocase SecE subunit
LIEPPGTMPGPYPAEQDSLMAVAVSSTSEPKQPKRPPEQMGLITSSAIGAVAVLAFLGLVLRGVPAAWYAIASAIGIKDQIVLMAVQVTAQLAAAVGLIYLSSRFGTGQKATGVRGGIFLMILTAFVVFFGVKGLYHASTQGFSFAGIIVMLFYVVILFLIVQMFRTGRFTGWAVTLDQAGWFDTHTHKRTQGLRVRRLTILGILLVAGSGVWTLLHHNYMPQNANVKLPENGEVSNRMGDWVIGGTLLEPDPKKYSPEENRARPRVEGGVTILPDLEFTLPLLLIAITLWFAWRAVNYPAFGDFLIATEAEINKVSWAPRRSLIRDTIVVLTTIILMTVFLFLIDVFWGWVLSQEWINVLPTSAELERAAPKQDNKTVDYW